MFDLSGSKRISAVVAILFVCAFALAEIQLGTVPTAQSPRRIAPPSGEGESTRQGYLLNLETQGGRVDLLSAAEIDNYIENKHLLADDDWYLVLLNERGDYLGTKTIGNPSRFSPIFSAEQRLPFATKIPRLAGLAEVVIYDQNREEQLRISVDDPFRAQAAANRQAFLAHDRANRQLLQDMATRRQARQYTAAARASRNTPLEGLPEDLQNHIRGEIALEFERTEQFGKEVMTLSKDLAIEPVEATRLVRDRRTASVQSLLTDAIAPVGGFSLSGQVTDLDSGMPVAGAVLNCSQYDTAGQYKGYIGQVTTDSAGRYALVVDVGTVRISPNYAAVVGKRYVNRTESVKVTGDTVWDFKAVPGILLSGTVTNEQGQGVSGVTLQTYAKDFQLYVYLTTTTGGRYSAVVPVNRQLRITFTAPSPYLPPPAEPAVIFSSDTIRDYRITAGLVVTGTVLGELDAPVPSASILLRQLAPTTTGAPNWYTSANSSGKFTITVPKNLEPDSFVLAAYASTYALWSAGLEITADVTYNIQLTKTRTLSGSVYDNAGKGVNGVRVRAYKSGTFVSSALTSGGGIYSFDLPDGIYDIEAQPAAGIGFAPVTARDVRVSEPGTLDLVLPPADGIINIKLYFPAFDVYSRFSSRSLVRFELYQSGMTVYAGSGVTGPWGSDPVQGKYYRTYTQYLKQGQYTLVAFIAGCRPITIDSVVVSSQSGISIDVPAPFMWTGVLRGADGVPLTGMSIQNYTDLAREYEWATTNSSGQFSILLTPNGFAKFYTNTSSNNILHTERFGDVTAGRNEDVRLDAFPPFSDSGSPLTQLYGVSDRSSRWNIVMIGDGYTDITETYTDRNANGKWDGVLYYDINKNGVWDTGEPYQRYGNAAAPVAGTDPSPTNEPFVDLNGDGVPNLQDQTLFDQNTLDTARSLFGQDEWQMHRDAFNIFRIRLVSRQAGHKIYDESNNVVIDRDTALGTYLNTPSRSYLFSANYTLVSQYINEYVPECDTRIILVNQPIRMGRVNSYMFQYGGDVPSLCNDYTVAHEMGHNVGLLADEYTEYQQTYVGSESAARNVTSITDAMLIPWRHLIPAWKETPSVPGSSGVGLYEGAGYYTGGKYRPTEFCMMVSGNRYCPVCTIEIENRLRDITAVIPEAKPLGPSVVVMNLYPEFKWEPLTGVSHYLLEVEKGDGSSLVASFDVYDTSFVLPVALADGGKYRWRIRPASPSRWGDASPWTYFETRYQAPVFSGLFPQIASGGSYQTSLIGINVDQTPADLLLSLFKGNGTPFDSRYADLVHFLINPMGTANLQLASTGDVVAGYARIYGSARIDGTALFKSVKDNLVLSEAGVGLSKPTRNFAVYVDDVNNSSSGYAVVNTGAALCNLRLTLRDASGTVLDHRDIPLEPGEHLSEYAYQRFAFPPGGGFEGSIGFTSDQDVAAVALRYDNVNLDPQWHVFSTVPVLVDEAATMLYFPHVAAGGGYRTNFILINPLASPVTATLHFYQDDGSPLQLPIEGSLRTTLDKSLGANGVVRFYTEGTTQEVSAGWVKVTSTAPIYGALVFQTIGGARILAEAGVAHSPLTQHFITYVETLGYAQSGVAISNPNDSDTTLSMSLRWPTGEIAATTEVSIPARGHLSRYFTQWFPKGFGEFGGTMEVTASAPVSAVALRCDNPLQDVFATLPVVILR